MKANKHRTERVSNGTSCYSRVRREITRLLFRHIRHAKLTAPRLKSTRFRMKYLLSKYLTECALCVCLHRVAHHALYPFFLLLRPDWLPVVFACRRHTTHQKIRQFPHQTRHRERQPPSTMSEDGKERKLITIITPFSHTLGTQERQAYAQQHKHETAVYPLGGTGRLQELKHLQSPRHRGTVN